ncbi:DNA-binding transcriptional MerR regulator [Paenibacillus shirakamiensis]|uniref:DNA-binding transcriptional MerR regulator n=1 Tax=Paenibacillus shirakamiensis TaxID=1265935 RepID=A0ABS4JKQ6_9BACL|nr:MerR family transcriptional regulator [Paenibacillus shirakamiensis]MBP2002278.1 DNA-binding transcriptional MerR regulator [Paenibacillus shirakamiensis]
MKSLWKVGELAKLTGLTVRTLHYYDQLGLLSPSGQTDAGHRLYNEMNVSRLHQIISLKELGLSLEEIQLALSSEQFSPLEIIGLQIHQIQEQIRQQQQLLEKLRHISKLMQGQNKVTVEDFTSLLQAMKIDVEKPVIARQRSWERHLELLGELLTKENESRES